MLPSFVLAVVLTAATPDPVAASLIAAERGFAADAQRYGVRLAFLAHFDADAWLFRPEPVAALAALARDPDDGTLLEWAPQRVGVAGSGDLGFSTGPWSSHRAGRDRMMHGQFLSVWKRGSDGIWRVQADGGIHYAAPPEHPGAMSVVPIAAEHGALDATARQQRERLLDRADADLRAALAADTTKSALPAFADAAIRVLRPTQWAADGADALALIARDPAGLGRGPRRALDLAASGDLGYTLGGAADCAGCGSYLRVWRWQDGAWKVLVDLSMAP